MEKMKKKILICGATGFIGRNIAEALAQKDEYEVYGTYFESEPLNNPKIKMIQADLTRKEDVDRVVKGIDFLVQAAAATSGAEGVINKHYSYVVDNAVMNALLFRTALDYKISHLIFLSCTTMYQSSDKPIKEIDFDANQEINPNYFGGAWTKVYNEKMCEFYSRIGSTKYTVIRHSNLYGPYDKYDLNKSHVFGATVTKVMTNKDGKIIVWGSGEEERDLLYVSDLVDFVELAIAKQENKFELFNAGYGSSISVADLVKKIISYSGKDIKIEYDLTKPTIKTKLCLNTVKAKNYLGWMPKISLDEGIKKTLTWYRDYFRII
ncbi:MAG: NAD(P)-dependent oxidoreductase [Candidatus Paceibacterota bacterium]